ncbi:MAG: hypothetical protein JST91_05075 [Actinobacteria bacterium]|nr:hypothetical protein [Actinomycetota bacterium]
MWIIEINFAGRQFTHRVFGRRWRVFAPKPRAAVQPASPRRGERVA